MTNEIQQSLQTLNLSAKQINQATGWPEFMTNDYLTNFANSATIAVSTDDLTDKVNQNILDIGVNATNISTNTTNIGVNTTNIGVNTQDILNLEFRALGFSRPDGYDSVSTSYAKGDRVVNPSTNLQRYYEALEDIPAPAGIFNLTKWQERSLVASLTPTDFCTQIIGGAVLLSQLVNDAIDSTANVATSIAPSTAEVSIINVGPAPAVYSQSYADQQTTLLNDIKAKHNELVNDSNNVLILANVIKLQHNELVSDLNLAIAQLNDLISKLKTSKQMDVI